MDEKEIKKLDEKAEEKISGGTKFLKDNLVDPKLEILAYGAPFIRIPRLPIRTLKPVEPKEKPEQPVEPLVPANPVKPLEQEK